MNSFWNSLREIGRGVLSPRRRERLGLRLRYRRQGYRFLSGHGLEIGGLHIPANLPKACSTTYADAISTDEAKKIFPEVNPHDLCHVSLIIDLDANGLSDIPDGRYDFAIMNHVIEHLANPILAVRELFRVVREGGYVVISAPDKNFTYDKFRQITTFEHLRTEYEQGVKEVSDEHYQDLVLSMLSSDQTLSDEELQERINENRKRREHAHVWDSGAFSSFLTNTMEFLGIRGTLVFVSDGGANRLEHFSVWCVSDSLPNQA